MPHGTSGASSALAVTGRGRARLPAALLGEPGGTAERCAVGTRAPARYRSGFLIVKMQGRPKLKPGGAGSGAPRVGRCCGLLPRSRLRPGGCRPLRTGAPSFPTLQHRRERPARFGQSGSTNTCPPRPRPPPPAAAPPGSAARTARRRCRPAPAGAEGPGRGRAVGAGAGGRPAASACAGAAAASTIRAGRGAPRPAAGPDGAHGGWRLAASPRPWRPRAGPWRRAGRSGARSSAAARLRTPAGEARACGGGSVRGAGGAAPARAGSDPAPCGAGAARCCWPRWAGCCRRERRAAESTATAGWTGRAAGGTASSAPSASTAATPPSAAAAARCATAAPAPRRASTRAAATTTGGRAAASRAGPETAPTGRQVRAGAARGGGAGPRFPQAGAAFISGRPSAGTRSARRDGASRVPSACGAAAALRCRSPAVNGGEKRTGRTVGGRRRDASGGFEPA